MPQNPNNQPTNLILKMPLLVDVINLSLLQSIIIICSLLRVSHWSLSDNNSPQVNRTLLSILTDLNKQ